MPASVAATAKGIVGAIPGDIIICSTPAKRLDFCAPKTHSIPSAVNAAVFSADKSLTSERITFAPALARARAAPMPLIPAPITKIFVFVYFMLITASNFPLIHSRLLKKYRRRHKVTLPAKRYEPPSFPTSLPVQSDDVKDSYETGDDR